MARKKTTQQEEPRILSKEPWISQRSGLIVIAVVSLGLGAYMTWQLEPTQGLGNALLWGLGAAVSIWLIFLGSYLLNTFLRR
ncbi:MAG: hypothetical protein Kow0077_17390 [Anaerolineae bacterium]